MKSIVVVYAGGKTGYRFEKVFDSKSAFDRVIEWSFLFESSVQTLVFTDPDNLSFVNKELSNIKNVSVVTKENWTNALIASETAAAQASFKADYAVLAWADTPFLNKALCLEIEKTHVQYRAEYTFADGFALGLTCSAADKGACSIIAALAQDSQKASGEKAASRDALFSIMSGDINSFEVETVIADKDYRMLRLNFECTTKAGFTLCRKLYEKARENNLSLESADFDIYKISDLAERSAELLKTLPSFYNIQISAKYNTKSLYIPCDRLSQVKNLSDMKLEDFRALVKKIYEFSENAYVSLSLFGEPSDNADFKEFACEVLKYPSLNLFIETDGLNFSKETAAAIAECNSRERVDIAVRLDAVDENMYSIINGTDGNNFKKALECVSLLNGYFEGHVYPQFTRMKANEGQLESFFRFWNEKTGPSSGKFIIVKYDSFAGLLSDEKPADLSPLERNPCWHLRRDMNILSDGTVIMCRTRFEEACGNAFKASLEEIWSNLTAEVQSHIEQNYCEKCRNCDEYYTFNF